MIYCCFGNLERVNVKTASAWKLRVQKGLKGLSQEGLWWHVHGVRSKDCLELTGTGIDILRFTSVSRASGQKVIVRAGGCRLNSSAEQWGCSHVHPLIYLFLFLITFQSETDCTGYSCGQAPCVGCLRKELSRQQLSPVINLHGKGCFSVVLLAPVKETRFLPKGTTLKE